MSDLLPYARFVDVTILMNTDASFTTMMRLKPADLDAETAETKASLRLIVHRSLSALDTGWCMHLSCIKSESAGYIPEEQCHFTDATTYSIDHERRMQYDHEGRHFEDEYILSFTYLPPSDRTSKLGAWFKTGTDEVNFDYTIYLDKFKDTVYGVVKSLTSSQFQVTQMSDDEILSHLVYCVNGVHAEVKNPEAHWTDLRYMIANQDVTTGTMPRIGDKYVQVVSVGGLPLDSYPMMLRGLINLPFEMWWSTRYIFLTPEDARKMIRRISDLHHQGRESAGRMLSKKYGTGEGGKINLAAVRYANEAEEALANIELNDYRFGKYTSCVVLFDEDK